MHIDCDETKRNRIFFFSRLTKWSKCPFGNLIKNSDQIAIDEYTHMTYMHTNVDDKNQDENLWMKNQSEMKWGENKKWKWIYV